MDRLTEISTRIKCYQEFLDDLEEITSALDTNTGLGFFIQVESEKVMYNQKLRAMISKHEALPWIKRDGHKEDYIGMLLILWARANAKIGEIAFLLEESIDYLERKEDEILDDMEQSANRQEEV